MVDNGEELTPLHKKANEVQLFLYSAATWNPHRIHYDREYALSEGHEDLVVHGHLQGNWLVEAALTGFGPSYRVRNIRYRNVKPAFVNRDYVVRGLVDSVEKHAGRTVECSLWVEGSGGETTRGQIVLERTDR